MHRTRTDAGDRYLDPEAHLHLGRHDDLDDAECHRVAQTYEVAVLVARNYP